MNKHEILYAIKNLANSQGSYSRLYEALTCGSDEAKYVLTKLENMKFKDVIDLILYLEE